MAPKGTVKKPAAAKTMVIGKAKATAAGKETTSTAKEKHAGIIKLERKEEEPTDESTITPQQRHVWKKGYDKMPKEVRDKWTATYEPTGGAPKLGMRLCTQSCRKM